MIKIGFPDPKLVECDINGENGTDERENNNYRISWEQRITFEEYGNCDTYIITSELFTIYELIKHRLLDANLGDAELIFPLLSENEFHTSFNIKDVQRCFILCTFVALSPMCTPNTKLIFHK